MSSEVLDLLATPASGYRELYYRWEREQWEAGNIDLAADAAAWPDLDPFERRHVADAVDRRRVRAEQAATALVAFVDAAPAEEQQVFLTTQLADEARSGVFLDRVAGEVFAATEQDMAERSAAARQALEPSLELLLRESLPLAAERLRAAGDPVTELVAAVARYHLGVIGMLGLTELRALLDAPGISRSLPGIHEGMAMMERDDIRHVAFALLLLQETVGDDRAAASLEAGINSVVPQALAALASMAAAAPGVGTAEKLQAGARTDLSAWLRAVKLRVPAAG